jgi:hypothetical protein
LHRTFRRISRLSTVLGVGVAIVGTGAFVMTSSYSSFTSATSNGANSWTAGSVKLTDDDGGSGVLFNASNLKPGSTGSNCITVTSDGSLPALVKLYATGASDNGLSAYVNLQIDVGTGGGFGSCGAFAAGQNVFTGTLSTFGAATGYTNGIDGKWTTSGSANESKVYRITYTLSPSAPDAAQSKTSSATLTWEAQNT